MVAASDYYRDNSCMGDFFSQPQTVSAQGAKETTCAKHEKYKCAASLSSSDKL